jgi:biopolymer transport protein ExbD
MKTESIDSGKYRILSEINMIPFIDVALVLLIIFMIMTPVLLKSQLKIVLPDAKAPDRVPAEEKTIDIQIQSDGGIYIEGKLLGNDDLEDALNYRVHIAAGQGLVIEADKGVPFQRVVDVMSAAKKVGLTRMAVCVLEERSHGPGKIK